MKIARLGIGMAGLMVIAGLMASPALAEENSSGFSGRCGSVAGSYNQAFIPAGDTLEVIFSQQNSLYWLIRGIPLEAGQAFPLDIGKWEAGIWENGDLPASLSSGSGIGVYDATRGAGVLSSPPSDWPSCVPWYDKPMCWRCPPPCTRCGIPPNQCPCPDIRYYKYSQSHKIGCPGTAGGWNRDQTLEDPNNLCIISDCHLTQTFHANYECWKYEPVTDWGCTCGTIDSEHPLKAVTPPYIEYYHTYCACDPDPEEPDELKCPFPCEGPMCICENDREWCVDGAPHTVLVSNIHPCQPCIDAYSCPSDCS